MLNPMVKGVNDGPKSVFSTLHGLYLAYTPSQRQLSRTPKSTDTGWW